MQQVIQISLSGHSAMFRLDVDAFDALRQYLERAREHLREEPDSEEVMHDLEQSIGEKLAGRLRSDQDVLNLADVDAILTEIGPVETGVEKPVATTELPRGRRRLYRIQEGQEVLGLCQGLAAYSKIPVDWIQTLFIMLALVTGGAFILVYFVWGFFVPVVATHKEWLAMQDALITSP